MKEKVIIFIDGDHIGETYSSAIFENASLYGEIAEAHCFADFTQKGNDWVKSSYKYRIEIHHVPTIKKQADGTDPNTSDIALTCEVVDKLFTREDIATYIIVSNDKDYMPLAKKIRFYGKKAVSFYTQKNDQTIIAFDDCKILKSSARKLPETKQEKQIVDEHIIKNKATAKPTAKKAPPKYDDDVLNKTVKIIEELLKDNDELKLSNLGTELKNNKIEFPGQLKTFLNKLWQQSKKLSEHYKLIKRGTTSYIAKI